MVIMRFNIKLSLSRQDKYEKLFYDVNFFSRVEGLSALKNQNLKLVVTVFEH